MEMRHRRYPLIVCALLLAGQMWAAPVYTPIPGLTSTGAGLTEGFLDVNFLLISAPAGVTTNVYPYVVRTTANFGYGYQEPAFPFLPGTWYPDSPEVKWLGVQPSYAGPTRSTLGPSDPAGTYIFETTFSLTAAQVSTAVINGVWAADNNGTVVLNGTQVAASPDWCATDPLAYCFLTPDTLIIDTGFVAGINHLDFVITNDVQPGPGNPVGLWAYLEGGSYGGFEPVPEPSTALLWGGGVAALAGIVLLRRRHPRQIASRLT